MRDYLLRKPEKRAANNAQRNQRYANDEQHRERCRARSRAWYKANKERALAGCKRRHVENRERDNRRQVAYAKANHDRFRSYQRLYQSGRRAKIRGRTGAIDLNALLHRAAGKCEICHGQLGEAYHVDHIIPIARGGRHEQGNLQIAHPRCNRLKGARLN